MKRMFETAKKNRGAIIALTTIMCATTIGAHAGPQSVSNRLIVSAKTPSSEPSVLGIKLLQEIFQKIHNMPALAIQNMQKAKQNMIQQTASSQMASNANGPTNLLLAIRPPVNAYTQVSDMEQQSGMHAYAAHRMADAPASFGSRRGTLVTDARPIRSRATGAPAATGAAIVGGSSTPVAAAPAYPANAVALQRPTPADAAAQPSGFAQLASNLGKFANVLASSRNAINGMQNLQAQGDASGGAETDSKAAEISTAGASANKSGVVEYGSFPSGSFNYGFPANGTRTPNVWHSAPQGATSAMRTPADNIYGDEGTSAPKAGLPATTTDGLVQDGNGTVMTPANPERYKYIRQTTVATEKSAPVAAKKSMARMTRDKALRKDAAAAEETDNANNREIALLPPNVITGIPLVHLGTSADQANRLLAARGKLNKLFVKGGKGTTLEAGWAVWTLTKPGTNDPAMYIYMRHGIIEALRVFDTSLVTSDFGVELGAPLSDVKRKFGEPAFIIAEPGVDPTTGGQNYVYPISQVCFQVARKQAAAQPQLVSILIFTVKDP